MIRPFIKSKKKSDQFSKYEVVLEIIRMPRACGDQMNPPSRRHRIISKKALKTVRVILKK
jgi:hypothetical protein